MTDNDYKKKVIQLFKSGKATIKQYEEMARAVLKTGRDRYYFSTQHIDLGVGLKPYKSEEEE